MKTLPTWVTNQSVDTHWPPLNDDRAYARMCVAGSLQIAKDAGIAGKSSGCATAPATAAVVGLRPPLEHSDKRLHWVSRWNQCDVFVWHGDGWFCPGFHQSFSPNDPYITTWCYLGPAEWRGATPIAAAYGNVDGLSDRMFIWALEVGAANLLTEELWRSLCGEAARRLSAATAGVPPPPDDSSEAFPANALKHSM